MGSKLIMITPSLKNQNPLIEYQKELYSLLEDLKTLSKRLLEYIPERPKKQIKKFPQRVIRHIYSIYSNKVYRIILHYLEFKEGIGHLFSTFTSIIKSLDPRKHGHYNNGRKAFDIRKLKEEVDDTLGYIKGYLNQNII